MRNWTARIVITLVLIAAISGGLPHAGEAAPPVTVVLARTTPVNSSLDAAGSWIFDGGTVSLAGVVVGQYARVLRTIFGATDLQNAAMVTITIFLLGQITPDNLTLQGAHSLTTSDATGSISAASLPGAVGIRWTLVGATNTLTFVGP
jgi:hypothetical protein